MNETPLRAQIRARFETAVPADVSKFAAILAARGGPSTAAVLFYGSGLRSGKLDEGLLDFYILVDKLRSWHRSSLAAAANWVLPPNVYYEQAQIGSRTLRAKVAVLSLRQFHRGMQTAAIDTTLWARFTQPAAGIWTRDAAAGDRCVAALEQAAMTAATWAMRLGPPSGSAEQFWNALFQHTYAAELRVESGARAGSLLDFDAAHYRALLPAAWREAQIEFAIDEKAGLKPRMEAAARRAAFSAWRWRQRAGKPLNLARLVKAAFTFADGADYLAWKIARHSGVKLELSDWQRRHPVLAAPGILLRLRRDRVIR